MPYYIIIAGMITMLSLGRVLRGKVPEGQGKASEGGWEKLALANISA